jgi:hypothetical protein
MASWTGGGRARRPRPNARISLKVRYYYSAMTSFLAPLLLVSACYLSMPQQGYRIPTVARNQDSEVIGAFLETLNASLHDKCVILAKETHAPAIEREWITNQIRASNANVQGYIDNLLESYRRRNSGDHSVPTSLNSPRVRVVSTDELRRLAVEAVGGRERLSERFPDAAVVADVSLPGYSRDRSWAILVVFVTRGPFAGEQSVVILHRRGGRWEVEWKEMLMAT